MAWRVPRWALSHFARDAGVSALSATDSGGTNREDPLYPLANLIDDRAGMLFKFTTSAAAHRIDMDRGSGTLLPITRLYIPANHNLTGTIDVLSDDNASFSSPTTHVNDAAVVAGTAVDEEFSGGTERYWRLLFNGTGQWEMSELYYTDTLTTTIGPEQGWDDDLIEHVLHLEKASGAAAHFQQGPDQRRWRLVYPGVSGTASLVPLLSLFANGTHRLFLFDPPYDDEDAILATLQNRRRQHETRVPASVSSSITYRYEFEVLESLS